MSPFKKAVSVNSVILSQTIIRLTRISSILRDPGARTLHELKRPHASSLAIFGVRTSFKRTRLTRRSASKRVRPSSLREIPGDFPLFQPPKLPRGSGSDLRAACTVIFSTNLILLRVVKKMGNEGFETPPQNFEENQQISKARCKIRCRCRQEPNRSRCQGVATGYGCLAPTGNPFKSGDSCTSGEWCIRLLKSAVQPVVTPISTGPFWYLS